MSIRVEEVSYGAGATERLLAAIAQVRRSDPLAPVTVVSAGARPAVHLRREAARRAGPSGLANVSFKLLSVLADELGAAELRTAGRRPLTRVSLGAAVRAVLRERPGRFAGVEEHPSTVQELSRAYEELRLGQGDRAEPSELGPAASELAALARAVRSRLESVTYDDVDLCAAAGVAVGQEAVARLGTVIVHLPDRLRPCEAELLRALGSELPLLVHLGRLDDPADSTNAQLRARLAGDARVPVLPSGRDGLAGLEATLPFRTCWSAPDPSSEVRAAVAVLLEHLAAGSPPERLAIAMPAPVPYARLVAERLDGVGLPWSGPAPDRLADRTPARLLASLVAAAESPLTRECLLELVGILPEGPGRVEPGEWARVVRRSGLTASDPGGWRRILTELAERLARDRERTDRLDAGSAGTSRGRRGERTVAACRGFAGWLEELESSLRSLRLARSWSELSSASVAALDRHLGPFRPQSDDADGREELEASLEELGRLELLDPGPDLGRFAQALAAAVDRPAPAVGRLGTGVVVGALSSLVGVDLDLVVVLGCVEGRLPARPEMSALLGPADRELLGLEPTDASHHLLRDRRMLLALLSGSGECVASVPRGDGASRRAFLASRFVGSERSLVGLPGPVAAVAAVAADGLGPLDREELEAAALLAARVGNGHGGDHLLADAPGLRRGLAVGAARERAGFDRFAGRVGEAGTRLDEALLSPTSLEHYASCPFRYFVSHLLSCELPDEPQRRTTIDPRDRGSLVHEVLEAFVGELVATTKEGEAGLAAGSEPGSAERLAELAEAALASYERRGRTGKPVLWAIERRRILAALEAERSADERRRAELGLRPVAVEHAFGFGEVSPVEVSVGRRRLAFRGLIDRIDRATDGSLSVVDYKTGRSTPYREMAEDPLDRGRRLQLPVYALAAERDFAGGPDRPARAVYRFVADVPEPEEFALDDEARRRFTEVLGVLADGIEQGLFPTRPGAAGYGGPAHCRFCDVAPGCGGDRQGQWERARSEAPLADYVALVEQEEEGRS